LPNLLIEVKAGYYANFQTYLRTQASNTLNLSQQLQDITLNEIQHLTYALIDSPITVLDLSINYFTDIELLAIIQGLNGTPIQKINFSLNDIQGLGSNSSKLSTDSWQLGQAKAWDNTRHFLQHAMAQSWSLALNTALKRTNISKLNFSSNDLNSNGASNLVRALAGTELTHIDFSGNSIEDSNITPLMHALENTQLTKLDLSLNHISDIGAINIAHHLTSTQLTNLNLSLNRKIGDKSAKVFKQILSDSEIIKLRLAHTSVSTSMQTSLNQALEQQHDMLEFYCFKRSAEIPRHINYLPLLQLTHSDLASPTRYNNNIRYKQPRSDLQFTRKTLQ
jgi:hypothetical protein